MKPDKEVSLSDYLYELPDELVALHPPERRGTSKLLVYNEGEVTHSQFSDLVTRLPENSLLVFNESKVIPARIRTITSKGKPIELFLLKPVVPNDPALALAAKESCVWECMVGRRKNWKEGETILFSIADFSLTASWEKRETNHVKFSWNRNSVSFAEVLEAVGKIPLPPYIHREAEESDKETYQTVYAKTEGSVAAPTAGLHFTDAILEDIKKAGHHTDFVTLHVGAGTFMPVKTENMLEHAMHSELVVVNIDFVKRLAEHEGNIVPVGTTSLRVLESLWHLGAESFPEVSRQIVQYPDTSGLSFTMREAMVRLAKKMEQKGVNFISFSTSIMIFPGYAIKSCDALITNFHQPGSTLLMLVSALIGDDWKRAYSQAKENGYRFFSYGDSSLLFKK